MARTSMMAKLVRKPKFKIRHRNRCLICGRPRGYLGKFKMCRLCFRQLVKRRAVPFPLQAETPEDEMLSPTRRRAKLWDEMTEGKPSAR